MDRSLLNYAPVYRNWYRLAHAKDTPEKRLAFYDGILDYAFLGSIPPDPMDMENPRGTDYARFDGFLTAQVSLDGILPRIISGALGGSKSGEKKARYGEANPRYKPALHNHKNGVTQAPDASDPRKESILSDASDPRNKKEKEKDNDKDNEKEKRSKERVSVQIPSTPTITEDERELFPPAYASKPNSVPSLDEAIELARQIKISKEYAVKFMNTLESSGWGYINRGGSHVSLTRSNFKAIIRSYYDQDKRRDAAEKKVPCDSLDASNVDFSRFGE